MRATASAHATTDRVEAALGLRSSGRLQEAVDLLSEPGEYTQDAYTLRGDLQMQLGQLHEAVGSYSTVIALDPENMYVHPHLATCLRKLKRWQPAADTFRKLLAHDSYSDPARIGLGECLLHLNKAAEALVCFEGCWSEAALAPALFGKAVALQMLRQFEQAETLYQQFLELNADSTEALSNLIALSMETFDLSRVQRYALQLLGKQPHSATALQALTLVAFERREYESAAEFYERLTETAGPLPAKADEGAIEYRLSPKDIEILNQIRRESSWRARAQSR
jgi:tetratricopeptide (TPR) repeat protein